MIHPTTILHSWQRFVFLRTISPVPEFVNSTDDQLINIICTIKHTFKSFFYISDNNKYLLQLVIIYCRTF